MENTSIFVHIFGTCKTGDENIEVTFSENIIDNLGGYTGEESWIVQVGYFNPHKVIGFSDL